ncbi:MAG: Stp1/IreP family PP2C-type Ser/Thr phosphatase [Anaerolineales bacterium]|nr:Stp1/IreP family PP2C-type Ser/Thr phosphatase [Anaerolineales bacterium]
MGNLNPHTDSISEHPGTKPFTNPRTDTRPLGVAQGFVCRPAGAVFGDAYLHRSLIFSDETQHQYLVAQIDPAESRQIRFCPNPVCGAWFLPRSGVPEKFCTDCGTVLVPCGDEMVLIESLAPLSDTLLQVTGRGLSHGSVRAPLAAFEEKLGGARRYCLVGPQTTPFQRRPEAAQAVKWGAGLARGLDYLHENGISFNGKVDASCFAVANEHAVWANFLNCMLPSEGIVADRQPDLRALAILIFHWLTGKTQYEPDPNLLPGLGRLFEQAFSAQGFATGSELADALEQAVQQAAAAQIIDYRMGRLTHVGMVRTINEDSLLTVELERITQSVTHPLGVYVVADGMGGHAAGEIASGTIVSVIAQQAFVGLMPTNVSLPDGQDRLGWLRQAVEAANKAVFDMRKAAGTDMGSTLVAAVLEGSTAYLAHVGDSRIYLVNAGGIQRLTIDHSLVERMISTNQITPEEARHHPQRNVVYRTIGDKLKVDVEVSTHHLSVGDYLLLCSDGLSGMVDDPTIQRVVLGASSPQAACDELVSLACAAGGDDNISVIIIKIVES